MCCESGVDGIGIGNGDGDTRSPIRGCFARGSVVSLGCVGWCNAGKKGVVSNYTSWLSDIQLLHRRRQPML